MSVKIVNSSAISDLKQRLNKRVEKRRKITKAVMAAIDYPDDPSVIGRPGYVWCRDRAISSADSGGVFQAFNPHVQKRVNLPVVIQNDPREPDRRVITGADWNTLADSSIYAEYPFDVVAHGKTHSFIPGRPTAEYSTDVVDVTERNISSGRVYPNSPAGMTCRVAPVTYVYIDEVKRYSGGTTQDFTANVPGVGLAEMDYICIDGSTNDLAYVRSNTFSWTTWTDPLPPTAYVTIPEGYVLLSSIILYNGMTSIVERNFTYEMRPIFNSVVDISVLSVHDALTLGADMAAIASLNTQELVLDNETANTVFAGPTTGAAADPTFRALVAADIASDLINDTHIDWGTGANQVGAVDVPIADSGDYFSTHNVEAALQQIGAASGHDAVTLAVDADTLLGLSTQQLTLDVQNANKVFAGPTTGADADPTFRALVAADIANDMVGDAHIDWGTGAGQVSGVDIPLADAGNYFTTDNVEAALQQLGAAGGHSAVTLGADAAVLLDLNGQEIDLDSQNANTVLAGPTTGAATDPTFRALVAADIPSLGYVPTAVTTAMLEPTGFVNRTTSTISFTDGTLTFNIAPTGANFSIYTAGTLYTKTSTDKIIANTAGLHYIYFDTSGVIQESTTPWDIGSANVPIACVLWDGSAGILMDERHGITMDNMTHEMLHESHGPSFVRGMAGTFGADGSTITIALGEWYDEDIEWITTEQTTCRVYWMEGTTWKWSAAQNPYFHVVSSVPQYNKLTGGSWALEPMGTSKYGIAWVFMSNHSTTPIMVVMGQNEYNNQAAAEAVLASSLVLGTLPAAEMLLLYRVVFLRNGAAITWKSTADYRRLQGGPVSNYVATDHGSLSGLSDDDHPQYDITLGADADVLLGNTGNQLTLDSQSANLIFAGPTTGAATDPTFRSLVTADLPSMAFAGGHSDVPANYSGAGGKALVVNAGATAVEFKTLQVWAQFLFSSDNNLYVRGSPSRIYMPVAMTIDKVFLSVGTAPTGASIIVDVNKNGTTIFTTQANRPTITASNYTAESGTPDVTSLAAGDYLTFDIDQVGSTVAGADMVVHVRCKQNILLV